MINIFFCSPYQENLGKPIMHNDTVGACCGSSFITKPKFKMYGIAVSDPSITIPKNKIKDGDVIDIVETKNGPIQIHSRTKW